MTNKGLHLPNKIQDKNIIPTAILIIRSGQTIYKQPQS